MPSATAKKPVNASRQDQPSPAPRKSFKMTEVGLVFDPDSEMEFKEWEELGRELVKLNKGISWLIGDWCNHGEGKYGESYTQAMDATGLDYNTLKNYKCIAAKFDTNRRRKSLTFSHHSIVAFMDLKEQNKWLDTAEKENWSVSQLRYAVGGGTITGGVGGEGTIMGGSGGGGGSGSGAKQKTAYQRGQDAWRDMAPLERKEFISFIETSDLQVAE